MSGNKIEVSILVLTYNSDLVRIIRTLDSVVKQKNVEFEIVISDDGSKQKEFEKVREYFRTKSFEKYKILENSENLGTVKNCYLGLIQCRGAYVKVICPGDSLTSDEMLHNWLLFMQIHSYKWSFSDVIPYEYNQGVATPISVMEHPNNKKIYIQGSPNSQRWEYLVFNDIAVGAAMLCERNLQLKYISEILDKISYAEDHIWRLMMFDGIVGGYYPHYAILYECGDGISTSKSNKWGKILEKDWKNADEIIFSRNTNDPFQMELKQGMADFKGNNKFRKLMLRGFVHNRLSKKNMSINYMPKREEL